MYLGLNSHNCEMNKYQRSIVDLLFNSEINKMKIIRDDESDNKTFFVKLPAGNSNKNAFFSLIMNLIFYIP